MPIKKIFSVKDIKEIENLEFKKRGNSFSLMINAGVNCAKKIIKLINKQPVVVVCGPGNNAGDGFILAEYLRKKNFDVNIFCLKKKYYKNDALKALNRLKIETKNISDFKVKKNAILIDCLFGTGISRKISGFLKKAILKINGSKQKIISIDIPSGINGDTGKVLGCAIKANITLALHAKKIGHTLYPGIDYCGKIIVINIGINKKFNNYFWLLAEIKPPQARLKNYWIGISFLFFCSGTIFSQPIDNRPSLSSAPFIFTSSEIVKDLENDLWDIPL